MLEIKNISMKYKVSTDRIMDIKEYVIAFLKGKLKYSEFWVFQDINFEVKKGEVIGIIGRNGAGKSTLLKIISGVLEPTKGEVNRHGNIVPMLELGSGFDFELSGRENIFLNGSILGYSEKFLHEKYNEIVEFSELGEFIESPLRNYSSGMVMRLAFAIATVVNPEILIVDEILAVGDEAFQLKSKRRMLELMSGGTTVLFVSHSIAQIRELCNRVAWIENGKMRMIGDTKKVCDAYQEFINPTENKEQYMQSVNRTLNETHKYYMDVLFVYGKMENNYYWRVSNQREQLLAANLCSGEVFYEDLTMDLAKKNRVFIFVQCPKEKKVLSFIEKIKKYNKTVLFDFSSLSIRENTFEEQMNLLEECKQLCDGIIVSNEVLKYKFEQEGYIVYYNPIVASERMLQVASWAKYDRDKLPYVDVKSLKSEDELINYNRAMIEHKKHKEDGFRIGCFLGESEQQGLKIVNSIEEISKEHPKVKIVIFDEGQDIEELVGEKYGDFVNVEKLDSREKKLRILASMDIILYLDRMELSNADNIEQEYINSSLVEIPFILYTPNNINKRLLEWGSTYCNSEEILLQKIKDYIENEKTDYDNSYVELNKDMLSVYTGNKFGYYISRCMKQSITFLVDLNQEDMSSEPLIQAVAMHKAGFDVLLLNDGSQSDDIRYNDIELPVLSRPNIYIYGSFDKVVATVWTTVNFLQSYTNIKQCYYLVQRYETQNFEEGQFNKFNANQTYNPCVSTKFITTSIECMNILQNDYDKEVTYIHPYNSEIDFDKYEIDIMKIYG